MIRACAKVASDALGRNSESRLRDTPRQAVQRLDFLGQDLAHARQFVLCQQFQRLDGQPAHMIAHVLTEARQEPADLARQFLAHGGKPQSSFQQDFGAKGFLLP